MIACRPSFSGITRSVIARSWAAGHTRRPRPRRRAPPRPHTPRRAFLTISRIASSSSTSRMVARLDLRILDEDSVADTGDDFRIRITGSRRDFFHWDRRRTRSTAFRGPPCPRRRACSSGSACRRQSASPRRRPASGRRAEDRDPPVEHLDLLLRRLLAVALVRAQLEDAGAPAVLGPAEWQFQLRNSVEGPHEGRVHADEGRGGGFGAQVRAAAFWYSVSAATRSGSEANESRFLCTSST